MKLTICGAHARDHILLPKSKNQEGGKIMRQIRIGALVILLALALVGSCIFAADPIRIGFSGALTGDGAAWGQQEKWGVMLAAQDINAAGGVLRRPLNVIYYDDRGDKLEVVNTVKRLITIDKVCAVLAHGYSSCSLAIAPLAEQYKIPFVTDMSTHPTVTEPNPGSGKPRPHYFRVVLTALTEGGALASFLREKEFKKAAVIYDVSQDYSLALRDAFNEKFIELGGKVVAQESVKGGREEEFRSVISSIKATAPDVIVLTVFYKEAALIIQQARALGVRQQFAGGNGLESHALVEIAGKAAEGAYLTTHFTPEDPRPIVQDFRKRFKQMTGLEPDSNGAKAYDSLLLVADAIKRAGSTKPQAIRDAIEKTVKLEGITGYITIDPKTHNPSGKDMSAVVLEIKNGEFHFVQAASVK